MARTGKPNAGNHQTKVRRRHRMGSAFNPLSITGLLAWYDFSDAATLFTDTSRTTPVSADGDAIKGVTDKSGNGNHISGATGAVYKTGIRNAKSVIRFTNAVSGELITASGLTQAQPITVFAAIAFSSANVAANWGVYGTGNFGANDIWITQVNATNPDKLFISAGTSLAGADIDTNWHQFTHLFNGASSDNRRDGTSATGDAGAHNLSNSVLRLGRDASTGTVNSMDIGEFMLVGASASFAAPETYLKSKWATP